MLILKMIATLGCSVGAPARDTAVRQSSIVKSSNRQSIVNPSSILGSGLLGRCSLSHSKCMSLLGQRYGLILGLRWSRLQSYSRPRFQPYYIIGWLAASSCAQRGCNKRGNLLHFSIDFHRETYYYQ